MPGRPPVVNMQSERKGKQLANGMPEELQGAERRVKHAKGRAFPRSCGDHFELYSIEPPAYRACLIGISDTTPSAHILTP